MAPIGNRAVIAAFAEDFEVDDRGEYVLISVNDVKLQLRVQGAEVSFEPITPYTAADIPDECLEIGFALEIATALRSAESVELVEAAFDDAEAQIAAVARRIHHPRARKVRVEETSEGQRVLGPGPESESLVSPSLVERVVEETLEATLPRCVDTGSALPRLWAITGGSELSATLHGRVLNIAGERALSASRPLAALLRQNAQARQMTRRARAWSDGFELAATAFVLALLTIGTWFLACALWPVVICACVAVAVALGLPAVRGLSWESFRSAGGLVLTTAGFFIVFAFAYATVWLRDDSVLTGIGRHPRLGEMFLLSLGLAVSGGTLHVEVHHAARVVAYVELLFAFGTVAAVVAVLARRYLLPRPSLETQGQLPTGV